MIEAPPLPPIMPKQPPRSSIVHSESLFAAPALPKPSMPEFTAAELIDLGVSFTETDETRTVTVPFEAQRKLLQSIQQFGFSVPNAMQALIERCLVVLGFKGTAEYKVQDDTFTWLAWQSKNPKPEPVPAPAPPVQSQITAPLSGLAQFASGAVRDKNVAGSKDAAFPARYDLLSPIAIRRIAETYGEGALKYDDHNWRKGMPISTCLNHALAHIFAYMTGDESEGHLEHAAWNLMAVMHFEETQPELFDLKIDDYKL